MTSAACISGLPHVIFLAWGPEFRGSVNLDGKKITALFAANSN